MIKIICISKTSLEYKHLIDEYVKRLSKYVKVELIELKEEKIKSEDEKIKKEEALKLLQHIDASKTTITLDEKGQHYDSRAFAAFIKKQESADLQFVIGGPLGLDTTVINKANHTIALSKMTFTHQMVRVFLLEQLYRAYKINNNEQYHK